MIKVIKIKVLLLVAATLLATSLGAKQVSEDGARAIAQSYVVKATTKKMPGQAGTASETRLKMAYAAQNEALDTDYYVFNNCEEGGYIIVSGDDRAVPVLGYCDRGEFDPENVPGGLQSLLYGYSQEIEFLRESSLTAKASAPPVRNRVVKPLLKCKWGQNAPFNLECPVITDDNGRTRCAATGCPATAAAQIMYYYRWPDAGVGSHTYLWNKGGEELSGDFNHPYDWDKMLDYYVPDNYSDEQGSAVARLMRDVGVAAEMNYGPGSEASTWLLMDAMRNHFKYNKGMKIVLRGTKSITEWEDIIFDQLNNGYPIIFTGFTDTGGHTFVLDGYNADGLFHFNWGWTAKSDGYFRLTALNPNDQGTGSFEGGYNQGQEIIVNIYPDKGEQAPEKYFEITCDGYGPTVRSVELGDKVLIERHSLIGNGYGYGGHVDITTAYVLTDRNDKILEIIDGTERDMHMRLGARYSATVKKRSARVYTTSADMAEDDYRLHLMFKSEEAGVNEYRPLYYRPGVQRYVNVHVENGVMTFSAPKQGARGLKVEQLDYPQTVGDNTYFIADLTISNSGDEYTGNIRISYRENKDDEYNDMFNSQVTIANGGDESLRCDMFAPRGAGSYEMVVRTASGEILYGPCALVVAPNDEYELEAASQLKVGSEYMYQEYVSATIDVKNTGTGDFVGPVYFRISTNGFKRFEGHTDVMTIKAGETRAVNYNCVFEGLPETDYTIEALQLGGDKELTRADFRLLGSILTCSLNEALEKGVSDNLYNLTDNLTIVERHEPSVFVTDGYGNWIEIRMENDFKQMLELGTFKAGTVYGVYKNDDGNPMMDLTWLPQKGVKQDVDVQKVELSETMIVSSAQVIEVEGYFAVKDGKPMLLANATGGGAIEISADWLATSPTPTEGVNYVARGVVQIKAGRPIIYLTRELKSVSGIGDVVTEKVSYNVAGGVLIVEGAERVAVYNAAGAPVGAERVTSLPSGIYIVVADGKAFKVVVR